MIKIKEFFSKTSNTAINLFKKHPLTLIITFFTTLFLTIFLDSELITSNTITRITIFGVMWALGTMFTEALKFKNKIFTFMLYIFTAIIAFLFAKLPRDVYCNFNVHIIRIMVGYGLILFLLSMQIILKKENITFKEYLLKLFNNIVNSTITYGILNIGITLIIFIFVELILDGKYGNALIRSQILLLGLFYIPSILNAISYIKERKVSNFIKGLVKYVLLPLVTVSMLIIYIYIAKIILQMELPSNIIFRILAGIFIVGFPIWNMANNFDETKIIHKISTILPYAYLPFIILEIYSLGVRIISLGLTPIRYIGIMFIIFQILVLLFKILKKKVALNYTFLVLSILIFISCITPLNFNTMSKISQKYILENNLIKGTDFDLLPDSSKEKVYSAYNYLVNNFGEDYIPEYIKEMEEQINEFSLSTLGYDNRNYFYFSYNGSVDVNDFSTLLPIKVKEANYKNGDAKLYDYDDNYVTSININNLLIEIIKESKKTYEGAREFLIKNRYVYINETKTLYINDIHITYKRSSNEILHLSLSGYLLIK